MTAPLVYPPDSIFDWTTLEFACRNALLPLRDAILDLSTEPPTADEPDAPIVQLFLNTDIAPLSQFADSKLERVREFGNYSRQFLSALATVLGQFLHNGSDGLRFVVQKVEHVYFAVDKYLSLPEGSEFRSRATIDMCTAGRLCYDIRGKFPGILNGISRRHDFIAYCDLLGCKADISDPETIKAISAAGATWQAETCWRKRLRALASKIVAESKHGTPELSLRYLDYYLMLADPLIGKALAVGELADESNLLKQLAIKSGDDAEKPRPNRPHLSLFDKLVPQLLPGISFDKSEECAPLVLAATLERMADVEQVDSGGIVESDAQPDIETPPPKHPDAPESPKGDSGEFIFRRDGDGFYIQGFGERGRFNALKGFGQIHQLLVSKSVLNTALVNGSMITEKVKLTDLDNNQFKKYDSNQPATDKITIKQARERKDFLESRLSALNEERTPDAIDTIDTIEVELRGLDAYINSSLGKADKPRNLNDENDRLRAAIHGTIETACKKLRKNGCPELGNHLSNACQAVGKTYQYVASGLKINWVTE